MLHNFVNNPSFFIFIIRNHTISKIPSETEVHMTDILATDLAIDIENIHLTRKLTTHNLPNSFCSKSHLILKNSFKL